MARDGSPRAAKATGYHSITSVKLGRMKLLETPSSCAYFIDPNYIIVAMFASALIYKFLLDLN